MKQNCCKKVNVGIRFLGIIGYLGFLGIVIITLKFWNRPLPKDLADLMIALWAMSITAMLWLRIFSLSRLMMASKRMFQLSVVARFWIILLLLFLSPILEICQFSLRRTIIVPNFWCEPRSLLAINAKKLAEGIRQKDYFAQSVDADAPSIVIPTNLGTAILLIRPASVYMFILLEHEEGTWPMNFSLPPDCHWHIEQSSDGNSGAIVSEVVFYPCLIKNANSESNIADIIVSYLEELAVNGGQT